MRNYRQDYFYMLATGNDTPLLSFDKNQIVNTHMLFSSDPLDESYVVSLKLGYPIPKNPEMGDVLKKDQHPVISDRIKNLLQSMELKGVQFLPTIIRSPKTDEEYPGYWVLHIHNRINCLDTDRSEYDTVNDRVLEIKKLVFNLEVLDKVPLNERLVFALGEQGLYMFFHRSVVAQIIDLQPKNILFSCLAAIEDSEEPFDESLSAYVRYPVRKENKVKIKEKSMLERIREMKFDENGKLIG